MSRTAHGAPSGVRGSMPHPARTFSPSRTLDRGESQVSAGVRSRSQGVADILETDEAKGLLELAQASGSVTTDEIASALDDLELEPGQYEDLYHALEELQVEIVAIGGEA